MSDPRRTCPAGSEGETTAHESAPYARVDATVRGRVQGVGFRWFVSRAASRLELDGWVANRSDGSVELVAEGPMTALQNLLVIIRRGPAGAHVDAVEVRRFPATGSFRGFEICSGSHPGD